jgi:hypothetical protein
LARFFAGLYSLEAQFVAVPSSIVTRAVIDVANQRLARLDAEQRRFSRHVLRSTLGMAALGAVVGAYLWLLVIPTGLDARAPYGSITATCGFLRLAMSALLYLLKAVVAYVFARDAKAGWQAAPRW